MAGAECSTACSCSLVPAVNARLVLLLGSFSVRSVRRRAERATPCPPTCPLLRARPFGAVVLVRAVDPFSRAHLGIVGFRI